jgi:carbon storage regulator CsrA
MRNGLVLTRKVGEAVIIGDGLIEVIVTESKGGKVKLKISAPPPLLILRKEIFEKRQAEAEKL